MTQNNTKSHILTLKIASGGRYGLNFFYMMLKDALLLGFALSLDAFAAAFAYGSSRVKIKWSSCLLISGISSVMIVGAIVLGRLVMPLFPYQIAKYLGVIILFLTGLFKFFDALIKMLIKKHRNLKHSVQFSLSSLNFILTVYANPLEADTDFSKVLTPKEAIVLGIALSLDGLAAGFGISFHVTNLVILLIVMFVLGFLAVKAGELTGKRITSKTTLDLSWLGGLVLIGLSLFLL